jgi:hypothetical protein
MTMVKQKKIATLNIYRQAFELLNVAFIGNKIEDNLIKVFGLIYDRNTKKFEEFRVRI